MKHVKGANPLKHKDLLEKYGDNYVEVGGVRFYNPSWELVREGNEYVYKIHGVCLVENPRKQIV